MEQDAPSRIIRLGAFLFRIRGAAPLPVIAALLAIAGPPGPLLIAAVALALGGLGLRLWAVGHIGPGSRRRDAAVGPLCTTGPYAWCRNPLYLGNLLLWTSAAALTERALAIPAVILVFALHYGAIVRWEESRVSAEHREAWIAWSSQTPRWIPRGRTLRRALPPSGVGRGGPRADWRVAWRSERSTRLATLALSAGLILVGLLRDRP